MVKHIGNWVLTVTADKHEISFSFIRDTARAERRKLAREVDALAPDKLSYPIADISAISWKIARIKAWRSITAGGLKEGKDWVESAFDNNGSGKVL